MNDSPANTISQAGRTCGEALVALLARYDVELVFGIPGVHTLELYRGLENSPVRHVLARHEQGAGFMADGYARLSGKPGVCFLITGPGVTNAATAIGEAYSDSVPLLAISSVNARRFLGKGWGDLHETTDQRAIMAPLTAFSATALAPSDLSDLVARAYAVFDSARPRPVHIEVPIDVFPEPAEGVWAPRPRAGRPAADPAALERAAALLSQAKRPIILAGGGAKGCGPALRALMDRLDAPLMATNAGKGILPDDDPASVGSILWTPEGQAFLAEADVLLAVGTELAPTEVWDSNMVLDSRMIRIDIDPAMALDQYAAEIAIAADAGLALKGLLGTLDGRGSRALQPASERVAKLRAGPLRGPCPEHTTKHRKVLEILRSALPDQSSVFADMTQIGYSGNVFFPARREREWIYPAGYGTLGYAVPAAIGGAFAKPGCPMVALVGDHGLLYTGQELATAVEARLPLVVVLWNNNRLGQIHDEFVERKIAPIGVDLHNPDFVALAQAYGCRASRPASLEAFESDLREAFAESQGPWLIEVGDDCAGL